MICVGCVAGPVFLASPTRCPRFPTRRCNGCCFGSSGRILCFLSLRRLVGLGVGVEVIEPVGVGVGVGEGDPRNVRVGEGVGLGVGVEVIEPVGVGDGVGEGDSLNVRVGEGVGLGVGVEVIERCLASPTRWPR